jgi:glycosyltransferase involved in cell wall biosynthesis
VENYILITPVKDEAKNFDLLKKTVLNQTLKPVLWVIVDSNSSDNSFELAKLLSKNNGFIHAIKQKKFFYFS